LAVAAVFALGVGIHLLGRASDSETSSTLSPLLIEAEALFARAQAMLPDEDAPAGPPSTPKWSEARLLFAQAALKFGLGGSNRRRARALHQEAWCLRPNHDPNGTWEETIRLFDEAARVSKDSGDGEGWAVSMRAKGTCLHRDENPDGDWPAALAIADEVIAHCRTGRGFLGTLGDALHDRGWCLQPDNNLDSKNWAPSIAAYEEAERIQSGLSPTRWSRLQQANSAYQQGWCWQPGHHPEGAWPRAIRHYERAIEMFTAISDVTGRADGLRQVGKALLASDDSKDGWARATVALQEAADLYAEARNRGEEIRILELLGKTIRPDMDKRGSWARAGVVYSRLGALCSDDDPWLLGETLFAQALCRCEGDWKRAGAEERELIGRAEAALREAGDEERADEIASVLK